MKRLLLFTVALAVFVSLWIHFSKITCKMVGLPTSVGPIQTDFEAPFFNKLPKSSSTNLTCQYVPVNKQGIKETYLLAYLQRGFYDIASIRFRQVEGSDIAIAGMDLPGLPINFSSARSLSNDYSLFLGKIFQQEKFQSKIINTFVFGQQELFCKKPIRNLDDFKGLKIRITANQESYIAKLFNALGAKPIHIEYGETLNALQDQLVDCGVSSYLSAESAGWFKYLPYRMNFNLGNGVNAYLINLKTWNALNSRQKNSLTNSVNELTDDMWNYAEKAYKQSLLPCLSNEVNCKNKPELVLMSEQQLNQLQQVAIDRVLIPWINSCEATHPGCKSSWLKAAKNNLKLQNLSLRNL